MSAEVPRPEAEVPSERSRLARRNRRQLLLFAALTLLLSVVTVWGGRVWLKNSETLVFAVGDAGGPEARFAARLATVLRNTSSRLHLRIVPTGTMPGRWLNSSICRPTSPCCAPMPGCRRGRARSPCSSMTWCC